MVDETTNRHHFFFERKSYRTGLQAKFRNSHGLVVPVLVSAHRELHGTLGPPPLPTPDMMLGCMQRLNGVEELVARDRFYGIRAAMEFLGEYAEEIEEHELAVHADAIREHLGLQIGILATNRLVEVGAIA